MTKVEAAELAMLEQNVTVDLANKRVSIRYPTKGDLSQFRDNQGQAMGCATSLEKRLTWNKTCYLYNATFKGSSPSTRWSPGRVLSTTSLTTGCPSRAQ